MLRWDFEEKVFRRIDSKMCNLFRRLAMRKILKMGWPCSWQNNVFSVRSVIVVPRQWWEMGEGFIIIFI